MLEGAIGKSKLFYITIPTKAQYSTYQLLIVSLTSKNIFLST
jgi:hypothetical protein